MTQWSRLVQPTKKNASDVEERLTKFIEKVKLPDPAPDAPEGKNRITATFGHILHPTKPESSVKTAKNRRRVLAPVMPHPGAFMSMDTGLGMSKHTSIILNFAPAPGDGEEDRSNAPDMRLRLPLDPDSDFSNFAVPSESRLHAIVPWQIKDILLPGEAVDVRITQQHEMPLDIATQKPLQEFFAASNFNLSEGQLQTPSRTNFTIPEQWLQKESKDSTATVDVPYLFMGLEIHQSVDVKYKHQSHSLRYNSIEAGQHGGTRQELTLSTTSTSKMNPEKLPKKKRRFVKWVGQIATGQDIAWADGYKQLRERASTDTTQTGIDTPEWEDLMRDEVPTVGEFISTPGEPIDMAAECETALSTGHTLAERVQETLLEQDLPSISDMSRIEPGPITGGDDSPQQPSSLEEEATPEAQPTSQELESHVPQPQPIEGEAETSPETKGITEEDAQPESHGSSHAH